MHARRGFTIVELLLVIGIILIVAAFTLPGSALFLRRQQLNDTVYEFTNALERAHLQAMFDKNGSAFGVRVLSDSYVLFEGSSYAARNTDNDEIFPLSSSVSITGLSEIVFAELTGIPDATGTITISDSGNGGTDIIVNAHGILE